MLPSASTGNARLPTIYVEGIPIITLALDSSSHPVRIHIAATDRRGPVTEASLN